MPNTLTSDPQGAGQPLLSSSATPYHALGERLVTSDGRVFRYVKNGAAALVVGNFIQAPAEVANHQNLTPSNTAIGASTLTVTLGGTAATANQYAGGYAVVTVTPGLGQAFAILSHPAASGGATLTLTLADPTEVRVALTAAASKVDLIPNQYNGVIQNPVTTLTGACIGCAVYPIAISEYGWIQRSGLGVGLCASVVAVGSGLVVPSGTAGAATLDTAAISGGFAVGVAAETCATGETNAIMLSLE